MSALSVSNTPHLRRRLRLTLHSLSHALERTEALPASAPFAATAHSASPQFPNAMVTRKLAAALAAGNTVVMKAPAETPYSVLAIAEICRQAGVPDGVVNVVLTQKHTPDVGKELCENPLIHKLSFTGSTRVGKILMKQASGTLKKLSFELGGNAPFIVFEDADLDKAVNGVIACKFRCVPPLRLAISFDH